MNYKSPTAPSKWPKYYDTLCDECGDRVPAHHRHICDKDSREERRLLLEQLAPTSRGPE